MTIDDSVVQRALVEAEGRVRGIPGVSGVRIELMVDGRTVRHPASSPETDSSLPVKPNTIEVEGSSESRDICVRVLVQGHFDRAAMERSAENAAVAVQRSIRGQLMAQPHRATTGRGCGAGPGRQRVDDSED